MNSVPASILSAFNLSNSAGIQSYGSGHIHNTYLVENRKKYILQKVNTNVFKRPEIIAANNKAAAAYLRIHHPDYIFMRAIKSKSGSELIFDEQGLPWRLWPFFENTRSINQAEHEQEVYEAAVGFARLTKNLDGIDLSAFKPTLGRFHDLAWRYEQFEEARQNAAQSLIAKASEAIKLCESFNYLVKDYQNFVSGNELKLRIMHNDAKINNILFDSYTRKAAYVIDLDTLMPGYFIYDLGDMVRTMTSPVSEEEGEMSKIIFRKSFYEKVVLGYLSEMENLLTEAEKTAIPFAGKMMTYIMALRFLADFLRGNTYYHIGYPEQNLVRAKNQLHLLSLMAGTI